MVGFLAQNVFGYNLDHAKAVVGQNNSENTAALGKALMLMSFFPWLLCFLCYSFLHWSYPKDLRRLEQREEQRVTESNTERAAEHRMEKADVCMTNPQGREYKVERSL